MLLPSNEACVLVQMTARTLRDVPAHRRMSRHTFDDLAMSRIDSVAQTVAAELDEVPARQRESAQVQLVHAGRLILRQGGRETTVAAGELVVYDVSRPFEFVYPVAFRTTIVQVPAARLGLSGGTIHALASRPVSRTAPVGSALETLLQRADEGPAGSVSQAIVDAIRMLARERGGRVVEPAPPPRTRAGTAADRSALAEAARRHLDGVYAHPALSSAAAVAAALHVSARTLHAAFEDEPETLGAVTRRLRLARARLLLETTTDQVREIGAQAGYPDPTTFIRVFKAVEWMTPAQWRRRHGG